MSDMPESQRRNSRLQITYFLQALTVILVTGLAMLLLSRLLPFTIEQRWFRDSEIYFLATIANLVFFHTLSAHIAGESRARVLLGTAIVTLVASALLYGVYFVYATSGL